MVTDLPPKLRVERLDAQAFGAHATFVRLLATFDPEFRRGVLVDLLVDVGQVDRTNFVDTFRALVDRLWGPVGETSPEEIDAPTIPRT